MAYKITDKCIACGACAANCPVSCISDAGSKYEIDPSMCISCGTCAAVCPVLFGARSGKAEGTAAVLHPIHGLLRPGAVRLYGGSHPDPGAAGDPVSVSADQKENEIPLRPVVRSRIGCVCSAVSALRTGAGGSAEGLQLPGAVHF